METFYALPLLLVQVAVALFFAILFIQSGLDKVLDWKGNLSWQKEHFAKTIFGNYVTGLLAFLTILEVTAGFVSLAGAALLVITGENSLVALAGISLSAITLLILFSGQRIAKDYAGAASLAIYFAVAVLGLILF